MVAKKEEAKKKGAKKKVASVRPRVASRPAEKRKAAPKKRAAAKKKEICFVIMPFGDWFDDYSTNVYAPAIKSAGLEPRRADDLYRPSAIINDIWSYTKKAKLIVADLTDKNPNVFYELGLAHACTKPAILLTESMEDVPFDLRALRVLEYDKNDPNWGATLEADLKKAIEETLDTPLSTVLPTFLDEKDIARQTGSLTEDQRQIIGLKQDLESLRREIRTPSHVRSKRSDVDIGPQPAQELIRNLIKAGQSDDEIISTVAVLGPPASWVEGKIQIHRGKRKSD